MPEYTLLAKVEQIVTKEIQMSVTASSQEDAKSKAEEALKSYPNPINCVGVDRILTKSSNYWVPSKIETTFLKRKNKVT